MIAASEAYRMIVSEKLTLTTEIVPLESALGRHLAEDVFADMDQPPFDRVAMDGIAIRKKNLRHDTPLRILGTVAAGVPSCILPEGEVCFEVMTGAVVPEGAELIVRYEDITIQQGMASIIGDLSAMGNNFHVRGSDYECGSQVLTARTQIGSAHTSILASVGCTEVKVLALPKVAILSTGDELVDVGMRPGPSQIRWSNGVALQHELHSFGLKNVLIQKVGDDEKIIRGAMEKLLATHDVLLLTGGVSAGKFDFVPKLLKACNVSEIFHKVAQRPGKPLWFGRTDDQKVVFGLPGNPVSCLINLRKYVVPFLLASFDQRPSFEKCVLGREVRFNKNFTYYCPVKVSNVEGRIVAFPLTGNGSGDFFQLRDSDGFVVLDPHDAPFVPDLVLDLYRWGERHV